jgi:hypothetical protein
MTAGKSDEETHKNELHDKGKGLPAHRAGSEDDMAAAILVRLPLWNPERC